MTAEEAWKDLDRVLLALALELPDTVWDDATQRIRTAVGTIVDAARGGEPQRPEGPVSEEPYFIEIDKNGCERCGAGKQWAVVCPDGDMLGVTFDDEDDAAELAAHMNDAHAAGKAPG